MTRRKRQCTEDDDDSSGGQDSDGSFYDGENSCSYNGGERMGRTKRCMVCSEMIASTGMPK